MSARTCLSAKTLQLLSGGELAPATIREIESHVEECDQCREWLTNESDSQWQDDIRQVLISEDSAVCPPTVGTEDDQELHSLDSILELLGPTDDPHMLGRIGSYEIVGVIGRGGMGIVFKAFDATLNRFVAIKMLLPQLATSGAARKRFAREGQAAAAVVDDHVMPIYNVDQWQGTPYLVTQYSRGPTLQQRIQDQGLLEVKEILRVAMQTARGLSAAHAQGLVHRDVKPSNILLDGTVERAMLTDFGLARAVDDASITRTGIITGTPQYMSPEQARGGNVDARSDLFGLGCVMYVMCTGRTPFRADNSYAILRLIADEDPRPVQEINADIPAWLTSIISKLMSKKADDRYSSADEVAELLEGCLAYVQQPTKQDLPAAVTHASRENGSSTFGTRWAMTGLMLVFLAAGAFAVNEWRYGKLIIECSADDVPIRITQGDTVVESVSVSSTGTSLKVAAGKYRVEVVGDHREFSIEKDTVILKRGGSESVKITLEDRPTEPTHDVAQEHRQDLEQSLGQGVEKGLNDFDQVAGSQRKLIKESAVTVANPGAAKRLQLDDGTSFSFRWCPAGEFQMGSNPHFVDQYGDLAVAPHRVQLTRGFWLAETEVTRGQYDNVVGSIPSPTWAATRGPDMKQFPVENVSWHDAAEFCKRLSARLPGNTFRLPTEAEWEYACRAGDTTPRYGEIEDIAWVFANTDEHTSGSTGHRPVGQKQPNAWGLHDMFGNVSEWCADWSGPAATELSIDPTGPKFGSRRVFRGDDCLADATFMREDGQCMAASRNSAQPEAKSRTRGFRVILLMGPDTGNESQEARLLEQPTRDEIRIEKTFQRYSRMVEQRNWQEVLSVWTEDCRDEMILEQLLFAELAAAFSKQIDDQAGDDANERFLRSGQFLVQLKKQFPALGSDQSGANAMSAALEKQLRSLDPNERRQARITTVRSFQGIDRGKLFVSLIDFMSRLDGSDFNGQQTSTLVDIDIRGDEASAIVVSGDGSKRTPITFRKSETFWKLDKLVNHSVMDQMTAINREIEAVNAMIADSTAEQMRKAAVPEDEIEAMREEILSATRPPKIEK